MHTVSFYVYIIIALLSSILETVTNCLYVFLRLFLADNSAVSFDLEILQPPEVHGWEGEGYSL